MKLAFLSLTIAGLILLLAFILKQRLSMNPSTATGRHTFMRMMVWMMRWMTRYAGFIARPIVRVYGNNEIIACGIRDVSGSVSILYTPKLGQRNHAVLHRNERDWIHETTIAMPNFSGTVVSRLLLPHAPNGNRYKLVGTSANGRRLSSPTITVKPTTIYDSALLQIESTERPIVCFSWLKAETYDPMIYFLAIEEGSGNTTNTAIYTRETAWCCPKTKTASYSVGPSTPPPLQPGTEYVAKLLLVDYDGWVSHISISTFAVPR